MSAIVNKIIVPASKVLVWAVTPAARRSRTRRIVQRFYIVMSVALLAYAFFVGCASTPSSVPPGTRLDLPEQGPEPGPLEEQLRSYLIEMTEIISTPTEDPRQTVMRLGRYLDANHDAIVETAQRVAERADQMSPPDRVYYDEHFADFFTPATLEWTEALQAFREQYPRAATRIEGLMIFFD